MKDNLKKKPKEVILKPKWYHAFIGQICFAFSGMTFAGFQEPSNRAEFQTNHLTRNWKKGCRWTQLLPRKFPTNASPVDQGCSQCVEAQKKLRALQHELQEMQDGMRLVLVVGFTKRLLSTRWWQLKYFLFSPYLGRWSKFWRIIFFKRVGSTTY